MAKVIPMSVRYELVMRTKSGVELFHEHTTNTYMSEDMDAVMNAITEDMESKRYPDSIIATCLFNKLQKATLINI